MPGTNLNEQLLETVKRICVPGHGILAADESTGTIANRLRSVNMENTEENRRAYRELLFGAPGLSNYVSGVIMYDETLMKHGTAAGPSFVDLLNRLGIVPGIKVDLGVKTLFGTSGETTTQGLDDLDRRCANYHLRGARFAKWRSVLKIGPHEPSELAISQNAEGLARYARICQDNAIVPIIEPEILLDGDHSIETCQCVSENVWSAVYRACMQHHVFLEGSLLKPAMVLPGIRATRASPEAIARATVTALRRAVPAAVPGIVFLSGGQTEEEAALNLNAINRFEANKPWFLSFSFARALQSSAIQAWAGKPENVERAREVFIARAKACSEAQLGTYQGGGDDQAKKDLFEKDYRY